MEIILLQDVEQLGKAGERVKVRDGYSRNYLIPRRLAVPVTSGGLRFLEAKKKRAEEKREKEKAASVALSDKLQKISCVIRSKAGPEGKLYGSVTRQDIAAELRKQGFDIEKKYIDLFDVIHQVGEYQVRIHLHEEVNVTLKVTVVQA